MDTEFLDDFLLYIDSIDSSVSDFTPMNIDSSDPFSSSLLSPSQNRDSASLFSGPVPVLPAKEIPPVRQVGVDVVVDVDVDVHDDLSDLIILPNFGRPGYYIEHSNLFLEYRTELDEKKFTAWITGLSDSRKIEIISLSVVCISGHTYVDVSWNGKLRSKRRNILDYIGKRPIARKAYTYENQKRIRKYLARAETFPI